MSVLLDNIQGEFLAALQFIQQELLCVFSLIVCTDLCRL